MCFDTEKARNRCCGDISRSLANFSFATTYLLLMGSMRSFFRKYFHRYVVSAWRLISFTPPKNFESSGEHLYMTWRPPAAFRLRCSSRSFSISAELRGVHIASSFAYLVLSFSAMCSYCARTLSDIVLHSVPSCRAMSWNDKFGFSSLIFGLLSAQNIMYGPFGPFGRVGSVTSFVFPLHPGFFFNAFFFCCAPVLAASCARLIKSVLFVSASVIYRDLKDRSQRLVVNAFFSSRVRERRV